MLFYIGRLSGKRYTRIMQFWESPLQYADIILEYGFKIEVYKDDSNVQ